MLTYPEPLNRETLRRILTEPKNSIIRQYEKLFDMDEIKLTFQEVALVFIVDKGGEFKLGAHGLRSICEAIMTDAMFELPSTDTKSFVIDKAFAESKIEKTNLSRLSA